MGAFYDTFDIFVLEFKYIRHSSSNYSTRIRKILTKNGHRIPSIDVIEKTLKFFKEKGWVNCRFQNNNEVWFLTPEMNVLMKKIKIK